MITNTVPITGPLAPTSTLDNYPVIYKSKYLSGSLVTVSTVTERDNYPSLKREEGMLIYIEQSSHPESGKYWKLKSPPWSFTSSDWEEYNPKLPDIDTNKIVGRISPGTGPVEELTPAQVKTMLGLDVQIDSNLKFFADPVLDIINVNTFTPTPVIGDRYIITSVSTPNPYWTLALPAGSDENDIIEYDGTNWVLVHDVSSIGKGIIAINKSNDKLYVYNGTIWTTETISVNAVDVAYDNTNSGASETDAQAAFDYLYGVVNKLIPEAPPAFPASVLTFTSTGISPKLCAGYTNNAGAGAPPAGSAIVRITTNATSNIMSPAGPGDSGVLTLYLNGSSAGSVTFNSSNNSGIYGDLQVVANADYSTLVSIPSGFWQYFTTRVFNSNIPSGVSKFEITHSLAGTTGNVFLVRDNLVTTPTVTNGIVTENTPNISYSSSIPHYSNLSTINISALNITNLSGQTYSDVSSFLTIAGAQALGGSLISGSGVGIEAHNYSYGSLSVPTPLPTNYSIAASSSVICSVSNSIPSFCSTRLRVTAANVNGTSTVHEINNPVILIKTTATASNVVYEERLYGSTLPMVTPLINPVRIKDVAGDTPAFTYTLTSGDWVSSDPLLPHNATVVGGVLKHDETNYSIGYLPVGPNLSSGRSGPQYFTILARNPATSQFIFKYSGKLSGCWIKLVGVSDIYSPSENGWWDAFIPYNGAGIPGDISLGGNGSHGCALGGVLNTSTVTNKEQIITFGSASSSSATNYNILIRIKLLPGDFITSLYINQV